jgi:hypothetical protein
MAKKQTNIKVKHERVIKNQSSNNKTMPKILRANSSRHQVLYLAPGWHALETIFLAKDVYNALKKNALIIPF